MTGFMLLFFHFIIFFISEICAKIVIKEDDFTISDFPWGKDFSGTQPFPDRSGEQCGENAATLSMASPSPCWFSKNDTFLSETVPKWTIFRGANVTYPWRSGFSSPRLVGGIATFNKSAFTYTPNLEFEVVTRSSTGVLTYNYSRIDATLDGYLYAARMKDLLIVLDNVPYAFVKPENRFYLVYGMGQAPDNPSEYAAFIENLLSHMVERYGMEVVSTWRFRLGTECNGPRYGPPWQNYTAPNPPFISPNGIGGNFTSRNNGLKSYVETYIAVGKAVKKVVPKAGFGPSNFAAISSNEDGVPDKSCVTCPYLLEFLKQIKAAEAPIDFICASDYSHWDHNGFAPTFKMARAIYFLDFAKKSVGLTEVPIEVHEWGWAAWGKWAPDFGTVTWPMGVYGASWGLGSLLWQRKAGCSRVFHWAYNMDASLNRGYNGMPGNASSSCMPGTKWCSLPDIKAGCKPTCRLRGYPLISGNGWLFSALNQIESFPPSDGDTAVTTSAAAATFEFVKDINLPKQHGYNYTVGGIKHVNSNLLSYIISYYSPDSTEKKK